MEQGMYGSGVSSLTESSGAGGKSAGGPGSLLGDRGVTTFLRSHVQGAVGSYSRVYFGRWEDESPVLIKILLRQSYDPMSLVTIVQAAARSVRCMSVCPISVVGPIAMCVEQPMIGLVFPYVASESLQVPMTRFIGNRSDEASLARVQEKEGSVLPLSCARKLLLSIARALLVIHKQAKLGHGSLKPSNILMMMGSAYSSGSQPGTPTSPGLSESSTRLNGVVLTDTALNGIKSNMGTMTVVPSVAYMAPENLQGLDGGCAADIFVMGTLIYELTTGKYAFYGHNAMDVGHQILAGHRPSLDEIEDPAVVALIERCWVVDPKSRATCEEVVMKLQTMQVRTM